MQRIQVLQRYADEMGNELVFDGDPVDSAIDVRFEGRGNRLFVAREAKVVDLCVQFAGDGGRIRIGPTVNVSTGLRLALRAGHESRIEIGADVGTEGPVLVSAVEGAEVSIGEDAMFFHGIEIRSDDTHPIYSVTSGIRVNDSRSIRIGDHVWLANHVTVMGGVTIGDGAVIGTRSIVETRIPNNCIAMGAPARVVRRDVAWERPVVTDRKPGQLTPRDGERTAQFWNLTHNAAP